MQTMFVDSFNKQMPLTITVEGVELELKFTDDQTGDHITPARLLAMPGQSQRWYTPVYREY